MILRTHFEAPDLEKIRKDCVVSRVSRPTVDQANKQNFVVNIQDSEFGKLVVR
jgi:hypothetical protein